MGIMPKDEELLCYNAPARASTIDLVNSCRAKFMWRERYKLIPNYYKVQEALTTGTFFHSFQENGPDKMSVVFDSLESECKRLERLIEEEGDLLGEKELDIRKLRKCFDTARLMSELLWKKFPPSKEVRTVFAEKKIRVVERSKGGKGLVTYEGTIDKLVSRDPNCTSNFYLSDYKTNSYDAQRVASCYPYSAAAKIYRNLVHHWLEYYGNDPRQLKGFCLEIVKKCTLKFSPNTLDSNKSGEFESKWKAYLDRCNKWYDGKDESLITQFVMCYGSDDPLMDQEMWSQIKAANTLGYLPDPLQECEDVFSKYPRNSRQCMNIGGNLCPYHELCSSDQRLWPSIIRKKFRQEVKKPDLDVETIVVEAGRGFEA